MSTISVKISALDEADKKLKMLSEMCSKIDTKAPETVGGGASVNALEKIAVAYRDMNTEFATLISNTSAFINNTKDQFVLNDKLTTMFKHSSPKL